MQRNCIKCGHTKTDATGDELEECPVCGAIYSRTRQQRIPAAPRRNAAAPQSDIWRGSTLLCIALGLCCLLVGGYFLINPTVAVADYSGIGTDQVVNFQKLVMGATLSLVGAIFLAAGIRPR